MGYLKKMEKNLKREHELFAKSQDYYFSFLSNIGLVLLLYIQNAYSKKDIVSSLDRYIDDALLLLLQDVLTQDVVVDIIKDCTSVLKFICSDRKMGV